MVCGAASSDGASALDKVDMEGPRKLPSPAPYFVRLWSALVESETRPIRTPLDSA